MNRTEVRFKEAFGAVSREALIENQKSFLELAKSQFDSLKRESNQQLSEKKKLIDLSIKDLRSHLENLSKQTSELHGQMAESRKGIDQLSDTTSKLGQILSSSQARGQWGEKMVEDILEFMGLMEGVNYEKQSQEGSGRPDFTFKLPQGRRINMDVKFPWSHYVTLFDADSPEQRKIEKKQFIIDVKIHIKEIAKREYIDPAGGTVDYVLMFIPNEGIYSYLNREGEGIIDFAMEKKVLVCSPLTLYAVLSMIRQSVDNFKMETRASELQSLMQTFKKQWILFAEKMERVGKSINQTQTHFQELESTRSKQLERPVDKILDLKLDRSGEADDKVVKKIEN